MDITRIPPLNQRLHIIKPFHGNKIEEVRLRRAFGRKMDIDDM